MIRKCVIILIETYWNVNSSSQNTNDRLRHILIETYWNLNKSIDQLKGYGLRILIETYWNVNQFRLSLLHVVSAY